MEKYYKHFENSSTYIGEFYIYMANGIDNAKSYFEKDIMFSNMIRSLENDFASRDELRRRILYLSLFEERANPSKNGVTSLCEPSITAYCYALYKVNPLFDINEFNLPFKKYRLIYHLCS